MDLNQIRVPRKTVIAGAGVGAAAAALAACSDGGSSGRGADQPSSSSAAPGAPLAATADVPVGSGVVVGDVVLTQPVAGRFQGFSSVCTHAGCRVNKVVDGLIDCPCHGSKFRLDGSVADGPADKPLETVAVRVQGTSIVKA